MTNFLNALKIEINKHVQDYDELINNYGSLLAELRLERQGIICLLEERDDNNNFIVKVKERKDSIEYKTFLQLELTTYQKKENNMIV